MKLGGRRFTAIHVDILRAVNAVTVPEEVASRTRLPLLHPMGWEARDDTGCRPLTVFGSLTPLGQSSTSWSRLKQRSGLDILPCALSSRVPTQLTHSARPR
jgi:hypothetical protein